MTDRRLVMGTDPIAHAMVGDTPYARVLADDIHASLSVTWGERVGPEAQLGLPDRSLTPAGARSSTQPILGAVFDSAVVSQQAVADDFGHDALMIALGAATPSGVGLGNAVHISRTARTVVLERPWFSSDTQLAQTALAFCGAGVPVSMGDTTALRRCLHPELVSAIPGEPRDLLDDQLAADAVGARLQRLAWRWHDRVLDWTIDGTTTLTPRRLPPISVLLATNRPDFVAPALRRIAAQTHPAVEVIVALHGTTADGVEELLRDSGLQGHVLEIDAALPLGQVLNAAAARANGLVVTKWDDDDLYSSDHLVDVCLGLRYSGCDMVGKAPEFIHFQSDDVTILRNHADFEQRSTVISGGTMTMPRTVFDDLGGFPPIPRAVDHYMKRAILAAGGSVYRMHGFGFVLVRHQHGHTWEPEGDALTTGTQRRWVGIPRVADVIESSHR